MMHQANTTCLLEANVAVALRLIRSGTVPRRFFRWLANPSRLGPQAAEIDAVSPPIRKSLEAIFNPILDDAEPWEQRETRNASQWLAAISQYVAECYSQGQMGFALRLYAMSLLPMYRTLATGNVHEGFLQTRQQLLESLALLGLCQELMGVSDGDSSGDELLEVLEASFRDKKTPSAAVEEHLNLDLPCIGRAIGMLVEDFDDKAGEFLPTAHNRIDAISEDEPTSVADWADSDLLWRLAGELISKKSEMVLPRPWIDTPVPWSSIGDHWNTLSHLLSSRNHRVNDGMTTPESDEDWQSLTEDGDLVSSLAANGSDEAPHGIQASSPEVQLSEKIDRVEAAVDAAIDQPTPNRTTAVTPLEHVLPKVIIAEIRSHNDPVFVKVLKRQIANCRADERSVCIATIVVQPEQETDRAGVCGVRDNGMTLWQQKLVNWIADQENVVDPYAFLTSDGELILCVLDLERNEMTSTLRKGLITVLTGQRVEDAPDLSLAKVNIPARFHAGIASTSSPAANFSPQQLIEPAIRCLSAASRHGKASIKSIEVF